MAWESFLKKYWPNSPAECLRCQFRAQVFAMFHFIAAFQNIFDDNFVIVDPFINATCIMNGTGRFSEKILTEQPERTARSVFSFWEILAITVSKYFLWKFSESWPFEVNKTIRMRDLWKGTLKKQFVSEVKIGK